MPLYEYQCDACDHRFEVIQKFADAPLDVCPKCGGAVRKLLSSPAIQFKGSGWYITDYARAGKSDGGKNDPGKGEAGKAPAGKGETGSGGPASDTGSASNSEAKADGKPAAASESKPSASSSKSD